MFKNHGWQFQAILTFDEYLYRNTNATQVYHISRQAPFSCYSLQGKEKKKKVGASQHFPNDKSEVRRILKYQFLMLLRSLRYICE